MDRSQVVWRKKYLYKRYSPIALETASWPFTLQVPQWMTAPPKFSIRVFSSCKINFWMNHILWRLRHTKTSQICILHYHETTYVERLDINVTFNLRRAFRISYVTMKEFNFHFLEKLICQCWRNVTSILYLRVCLACGVLQSWPLGHFGQVLLENHQAKRRKAFFLG